jgi:hypothetical protein
VAQHEPLLPLRRLAEQPLVDLAVRAADAHLERPDEHLVRPRPGVGDLGDLGGALPPGHGDERLHADQAAVSPPSTVSTDPVTNRAPSETR